MSWRPSDRSPLGLDADPTPGDPVVVRDGGQHYQQVAQALASSAATLRALNGGATTGSFSVTALLEGCEEVLDDVTRAYDRYRVAGDALVAYAYSLDRVQAATAQALATARVAAEQADADRRRAASCAASASAAAGSGSKTAESDAASWNARAAQASADAALQDRIVDNQKMVVSQAVADRDTAATQASSQIEEITARDGLNDTWWDDWGAKLVAVVADIAQIVSMIAGILALLFAWCPLGALFLAIAAIAAVVAALANIVLAATGQRSWTEALISIAFAVLSCVGLGGLRGVLGALKAGAGFIKGGDLAAMGLKGLAAGTGKMIAGGAKNLANGLGATLKKLFGKTSEIHPPENVVPPYGELGPKTSGTLVSPNGTETALVSGNHPPASLLPRRTPGMNGNVRARVEAHAAAMMRQSSLQEATLWINKLPCGAGARWGCEYLLPRMIPTGSTLTIHVVPLGSLDTILKTIIVTGIG